MGRRPDPLVSEFFERGEKIGDSSNRYQHSCKRCGEVFPKGRVESLIGHLLRRCPNVTPEDRKLVVAQYQQKPEQQQVSGKKRRRSREPFSDLSRQEARPEHSATSIQRDPQQSALDTLAEVSRRHLDYSSHRSLPDSNQESEQQALGQLLAEQALIAELQQHNQSLEHGETAPGEFGSDLSIGASATVGEDDQSELSVPTSGLMQTASAANQALEHAQSRTDGQPASAVDPQLQQMPWLPLSEHEQSSEDKSDETIVDRDPALTSNMISVDAPQAVENLSVPGKEPTPGFGVLQRPSKSSSRSKFNDERRKEVHGIRKQGACMRCRMLKKPCSEGTPCNSCRNVETARVWKGTCTRSRLSEECTLWSAPLFRSYKDVAMLSTAVDPAPVALPGHLEVSFYDISELSMTLPGHLLSRGTIPDLSVYGGAQVDNGAIQQAWLSNEDEAMQQELQFHISQIADGYIDAVESIFMKTTLQHARMHIRNAEASSTSAPIINEGDPKPRSSYNVQNQLLDNTVELWILNDILTSPDRQSLQLRHVSPSSPRHSSTMIDQGNSQAFASTISNDSCPLVRAQIQAAIESRCNTLSRAVMNELERRLLQRKQVSRFATYLTAVILLNCVERMSAFYRSMEEEQKASDQPHEDDTANITDGQAQTQASKPSADTKATAQPNNSQTTPSSWPLQQIPSHFWLQGSLFANLLTSLLRIRALPPSVTKTSYGTLAVVKEDYSLPLHANGGRSIMSSRKDRMDQPDGEAAEWLDPLELRVHDLLEIRDREPPAPEMGVKAWDLRFISRLLLPGSM